MLKWLTGKIQGITISSIDELIYHTDSLRHTQNTQFWSKISEFIKSNKIRIEEIENVVLPESEILSDWFQNSLDSDTRKIFAANYTSIAAIELFNTFLPTTLPNNIIDPFSGSGRLIIGILDNLEKGASYPKITINEYMPFACILSYYNIMESYLQAGEPIDKITIYLGDAFTNLVKSQREKYDLIVMNPPFTRVHRIKSKTKKALESIKKSYPGLITGQPGLHYYALLLADLLIKNQGTIVSILPGSTFVSVYSKPLMDFYLDNYQIEKIIKLTESSAFSDGSTLKEVIFVAKKTMPTSQQVTSFELMNLATGAKFEVINQIPGLQLKENWNWLKYFENKQLLQLENLFLDTSLIQSGEALELNIIRGIEMYGPDFYCLPNSYWHVISEDDQAVVIQQVKDNKELTIPKKFLLRTLRKSGLYKNQISPNINEYILSIPKNDNINSDVKLYSELNIQNSQIAQKKFGKNWIHHTSDQINAKEPFGNLFFIDKLSLDSSGVICHFFEEQYSATKNFYIMKGNVDELRLQAAWLNSSCFLVLYLINRREIGPTIGRMQIIDLMKTRLFLNTKALPRHIQTNVIEQFELFRSESLQRIPDQIGKDFRMALDKTILLALGFEKGKISMILNNIYSLLNTKFLKI